MVAERYLRQKQGYNEYTPNYDLLAYSEYMLAQRRAQKKANKKKVKKQQSSNVVSIMKAKNRVQTQKHLKVLDEHITKTHKQSKAIADGSNSILGLVLIGGLALFGLTKYLDSKGKTFNPEYAPEKGSYTDRTGRYEDTGTGAIKNKIIDEAEAQGVDPSLALAVAEQESGFRQNARSRVDAVGIFQLMKPAVADYNRIHKTNYTIDDVAKSADLNIKVGIGYLKMCLDYAGGDVKTALAAYNAGPTVAVAAKKAGKDVDSITDKTKTDKGLIGYAASVLNRQGKYKNELANLKPKAVTSTNAGNITRYKNGKMVGNYKLNNTVAHGGEYYIDLSDRAEAYLRDTGGRGGLITSGAEGHNPKESGVSHGSGNKIDVQPFSGNSKNWKEWAELAIPFIKNKHTAFINFEDFYDNEYQAVRDEIQKIDPSLLKLMDSPAREKPNVAGKNKYCFNWLNPNHVNARARHLDIGIMTNAYSEKGFKQEKKIADDAEKQRQAEAKRKQLEAQQKALDEKKKQEKANKIQNKNQSKGTTGVITNTQKSSANKEKTYNTNSKSPLDHIKQQNINYKNARK